MDTPSFWVLIYAFSMHLLTRWGGCQKLRTGTRYLLYVRKYV